MNLRQIAFTLDQDSIEDAIGKVEEFIQDLYEAMDALAQKLAKEYGPDTVRMYIAQMDAVDTGQLLGSVHGFYSTSSREGYVFVGNGTPYAVYVEYGTGIIGKAMPHPQASDIGWEYDVNNHGTEGWVYHKRKPGWTNDDKGSFGWTVGYEARPFMYETFVTLEGIAEREGPQFVYQRLRK